jgi:tellurite resistance protein TehA-like permease
MDTGILSILLALVPYRFAGLGILSTILFVLNVALFGAFALLSLARLYMHRSHVVQTTTTSLEELSYLGAPATAYLTIVAQVALTCSTAWGFRWTVVAYALWWLGLVWTIGLTSFTLVVLAKKRLLTLSTVSPSVFMPLISVMTLGTTGGIITRYGVGVTPGMAVPVIVVAYMSIGYAFFLALVYYVLLATTLFTSGVPAPAKVPGLMVAVGPMGQFATAIQILSTAASSRGLFGAYHQGVWLQAQAASSVSAAAVLLALMALGFGFLWITVAGYVVVEHAVHRNLPFGLTWWSLIFPLGT